MIAGEGEGCGQKEEGRSAARRREGSDGDIWLYSCCGGGGVDIHGKHDDYGSSGGDCVYVYLLRGAGQNSSRREGKDGEAQEEKEVEGLDEGALELKIGWRTRWGWCVTYSVSVRPNCNSLQLAVAVFQLPATMYKTRCLMGWGNALDKR